MSQLDPRIANVPGPPWAPPNATWQQLIDMMRFWLKPGDEMFTDEQLQVIMLAANSFPRAVIAGTRFKMRIYNDPNRLKSASIGNESMTWGEPLTLERERELLNAIKADLGIRSSSRMFASDEYPQVYGVTPYRTSPYPEVLPSTWPYGSAAMVQTDSQGIDLSRSGGGTNQFQPEGPPPRPTPYERQPDVDEPTPPAPPRPTVRVRRNK